MRAASFRHHALQLAGACQNLPFSKRKVETFNKPSVYWRLDYILLQQYRFRFQAADQVRVLRGVQNFEFRVKRSECPELSEVQQRERRKHSKRILIALNFGVSDNLHRTFLDKLAACGHTVLRHGQLNACRQ